MIVNEEYMIVMHRLYMSCLNAAVVYEVLKTLGVDAHLPGYESCLKALHDTIAEADKVLFAP